MKWIFISLVMMFSLSACTQCSDCLPVKECISPDGQPWLCPHELQEGHFGKWFHDHLTFYMPFEVTDVNTGLGAHLLQVVISSVEGLPGGLQFTMDEEDFTYHPVNHEEHGCVTVCGSPSATGEFIVVINITATVQLFGITFDKEQKLLLPITILP